MLTYFKNLFKKKEPKYCINCKWIDGERASPVCLNPNVKWDIISSVYGKTTSTIHCITARKFRLNTLGFYLCGPKAKYFEPK